MRRNYFCWLKIGAGYVGLVLFSAVLHAQPAGTIEGRVKNGTTGKVVRNQRIILLSPSQGMEEVGSVVTDNGGRFRFEKVTGPFFVAQTHYQGANYNQPVQPAERGLTQTTLTVYDATPSDANIVVSRAQWRLLPDSGKLRIDEVFEVTNRSSPPRTMVRSDGSFKFALPRSATVDSASVQGTAGMPLPQTPREISAGKLFAIDHPILPGVTRISVRLQADYAAHSFDFAQTLAHSMTELDLFLPKDMQVSALTKTSGEVLPGFERAPDLQGYQVLVARGKRANDVVALRVSGGSAPPAETAGEGGMGGAGGDQSDVTTLPNAIGALQVPLVSLFALIVLWSLGFAVFHRTHQAGKSIGLSPEKRKHLVDQKDYLVRRIIELDARFESKEIAERDYHLQRSRLRSKCVELMRRLHPSTSRKREKNIA